MFGKLSKKITNGYQAVPLFYVNFNLKKYKESGEPGSCDLALHPSLKDDEYVKKQLNEIVDHIRKNYDMEKLVKP